MSIRNRAAFAVLALGFAVSTVPAFAADAPAKKATVHHTSKKIKKAKAPAAAPAATTPPAKN